MLPHSAGQTDSLAQAAGQNSETGKKYEQREQSKGLSAVEKQRISSWVRKRFATQDRAYAR